MNDLGFQEDSNGRNTPALSSTILRAHKESEIHNEQWHYRLVIEKLNYLEKSTRPDARFGICGTSMRKIYGRSMS